MTKDGGAKAPPAPLVLTPVLNYNFVWWRLFHAPTSAEWSNAHILAKLLLSLLASNRKLECTFSLVGTKKYKRSCLTNQFYYCYWAIKYHSKTSMQMKVSVIDGQLKEDGSHKGNKSSTNPVALIVHRCLLKYTKPAFWEWTKRHAWKLGWTHEVDSDSDFYCYYTIMSLYIIYYYASHSIVNKINVQSTINLFNVWTAKTTQILSLTSQ